jgi:DASH complex subunit DAD3
MDDTQPLPGHEHSTILNLTTPSTTIGPLEQEVLDEYERLANNMEKLQSTLTSIATSPNNVTIEIAEGLRLLERKVASVYTLMKASVYSIVLQQGEGETDLSVSGSQVDDGQGREGG